MTEVIAEHIEIGGVFEYDIGRFLPARHADEAELAPQLALHALGGGFMRLHDSPSFYLYWVFFSMSFWYGSVQAASASCGANHRTPLFSSGLTESGSVSSASMR